jgi:mRNA interferase MazF
MIRDVKRGEIYQVDWSPARGSEQAGRRSALVIQNDTGNKFSPTTIVASCSTIAEKSYPFLVPIKAKGSGLRKDCTVNLASIMTNDYRKGPPRRQIRYAEPRQNG